MVFLKLSFPRLLLTFVSFSLTSLTLSASMTFHCPVSPLRSLITSFLGFVSSNYSFFLLFEYVSSSFFSFSVLLLHRRSRGRILRRPQLKRWAPSRWTPNPRPPFWLLYSLTSPTASRGPAPSYSVITLNLVCLNPYLPSFFYYLGLHLRHLKVPRLGVESELPVCTTATATPELSCIPKLHCSLRQHQILNPLNEAGDWTQVLKDTSLVLNPLSHNGNSTNKIDYRRVLPNLSLFILDHLQPALTINSTSITSVSVASAWASLQSPNYANWMPLLPIQNFCM